MKKLTLCIMAMFVAFAMVEAQVGVGTTTPDENAQLDISSTTKGVLLTRLDQTEADALATTLNGQVTPADNNGLIIYNTTVKCLQVWKDDQFDCIVVASGDDVGNAGNVKVNIRGTGNQTALAAATAGNTAHPGYLAWNTGGVSDGDIQTLDVAQTDLVLSSSPTTTWPENETNQTITGIFTDDETFTSETNDAWIENDKPGQVHFWRVIAYCETNSNIFNEANLECIIRNPESGFQTSSTQYAPLIGGTQIFEISFILVTIADNASLPSGSGLGYVFEFRNSNPALREAWIDSITRISVFAD